MGLFVSDGQSSKKEVRWEFKSSFSQLNPKHELVIQNSDVI
jgi:hypothetical protein